MPAPLVFGERRGGSRISLCYLGEGSKPIAPRASVSELCEVSARYER
jgi:hypothetical protein